MRHFCPHAVRERGIVDPCHGHGAVHALRLGNVAQDVGVADIAAVLKIGGEQSHFQRGLRAPATFAAKYGQQFMRVERVINAHAVAIIKRKADIVADVGQSIPVRTALFRRAAIFARNMLCGIFAFGRHIRVEFERMPVSFGGNVLADKRQRLLHLLQANDAPWADHVGDDVDA